MRWLLSLVFAAVCVAEPCEPIERWTRWLDGGTYDSITTVKDGLTTTISTVAPGRCVARFDIDPAFFPDHNYHKFTGVVVAAGVEPIRIDFDGARIREAAVYVGSLISRPLEPRPCFVCYSLTGQQHGICSHLPLDIGEYGDLWIDLTASGDDGQIDYCVFYPMDDDGNLFITVWSFPDEPVTPPDPCEFFEATPANCEECTEGCCAALCGPQEHVVVGE